MRLSLALSLLLVAAPAFGNPVLSEVLRARQLPKTTHVQVTIASMSVVAGTVEATRDGAALNVAWTKMASKYNTNTGSGVTGLDAMQFCDCDVPVGAHTYGAKAGAISLTAMVTVQMSLDPPDGGVIAGQDLMPWEVPDPIDFQGLDCSAACLVGPDMAVPPDMIVPIAPAKADSGCSVAGGPATVTTVAVLGLLAVLGLALRRR